MNSSVSEVSMVNLLPRAFPQPYALRGAKRMGHAAFHEHGTRPILLCLSWSHSSFTRCDSPAPHILRGASDQHACCAHSSPGVQGGESFRQYTLIVATTNRRKR